jgi:hypothetical protein
MATDDSFEAGFMFALHVFKTLPSPVTEDDLAKRLIEIRNGESTQYDGAIGPNGLNVSPIPGIFFDRHRAISAW